VSARSLPAALEADRLFDRTLPPEAAWVLEALAEIDDLKGGAGGAKAERRAAAEALYRKLEDGLGPLDEPTPPEHQHGSKRFRDWFTEAVLLWIRFSSTGSSLFIDTVGADTLVQFPVDLPLDASAAASLKEAVRRAFELSDEELEAVERKVLHLTSNLDLKRALARALAARLAGSVLHPLVARLQLMREFYGPLPFQPGDVDVIIAATTVFFLVPRKGSVLDVPGFSERPADEQRAVRDFLEKLDRANTAETRRFPSFGLYEPSLVSPELVESLARSCHAAAPVVAATLGTMFSFIPRTLHAQYLVHDLWGHTWQEALSEFEWEYALLPHLDRPLAHADGPEFGGPEAPTLGSAFLVRGGQVVLDEARLLAFGDADLRGRIQVATSIPLSEVLADFMESKFSRARPTLELPTSSLIPSTSLKVDLTISDTRAQVRRYARPYRNLATSPEVQARLAAELEALGLPRSGLDEAVARAGRLLWLEFAPAFDESLAPEPAAVGSNDIRSSVLRRLLLQFALVMVDLERALGLVKGGAENPEPWRDPKGSADLLAVALAHFYEEDRKANFWRMDQIARTEFARACDAVARGFG
jgi:hypothetical protein